MDGFDLFKKLGVGAKFDLKRFGDDAKKLQVIYVPKKHVPLENKDSTAKKRKLETCEDEKLKYKKFVKRGVDTSDNDDVQDTDEDIQLLGSITSLRNNKKKSKKKKKSQAKMAQIRQEEVNHLRRQHRINVNGSDLPDPLRSFNDLSAIYDINKQVLSNIQRAGYQQPTAIQRQAIPVMLQNRELLACAPTGSGKTAAFLIPIMHQLCQGHSKGGMRALILAPTRELAQQTYRECLRLAEGCTLKIHYIDTSNPIGKAGLKYDILVTTPNRLVYMLKQDPPAISLQRVEWLVVDESDKLFEEGKTGFRDQLAVIYKACDSKNVRRAMYSATFTHDVEQWCQLNLDNVIEVYIGAKNSATKDIKQELIFVGTEAGKLMAVRDIIRKGLHPPVLVFVQSKERAKELFQELVYDGINVDVIHADRNQTERDEVIKNFRCGKTWILICTELLGRGIDFKGINLVINYDFPNSAISYIHRIGRTGRAGRSGRAVTFFTEDDRVNLRSIANVLRGAGCPVPDYMLHLKQPSRKERKKMARSSIKRSRIRTYPKDDLDKAKQRRMNLKKKQQNNRSTQGKKKREK